MNEDEILEEYENDTSVTAVAIAKRERVPITIINTMLIKRGIPLRSIRERSMNMRLMHIANAIGHEHERDINTCENCGMFLVEDTTRIPEDWDWDINGRYGDICNACASETTMRVKKRFFRLTEIGCIICRKEYLEWTEPEIHHLRAGQGMGERRNHYKTIPLCPAHHRLGKAGVAFHAGRQQWEDTHGNELSLLKEVNTILEKYYEET